MTGRGYRPVWIKDGRVLRMDIARIRSASRQHRCAGSTLVFARLADDLWTEGHLDDVLLELMPLGSVPAVSGLSGSSTGAHTR